MAGRITKRVVDSLKVGDPDHWDSEIPGFGIRVQPSGMRVYILKYRIGKRQRWYTIGRHGLPWTAEEARKEALRLMGDVARGTDPAQQKTSHRQAPMLKEIIGRFIEEYVEPHLRESTRVGYVRHLRKVIEPALGSVLVRELSPAEVSSFHYGLRKTPRQANQAVAILRKLMNQAEKWGYRPLGTNPCAHVDLNAEKKRERFLTDDELYLLGTVLAEEEAKKNLPPQVVRAIKLLVFTGARHNEILKLRWDQVDLDARLIRFKPEDHKTGRKTGAKVLPISLPALGVLEIAPRMLGNPYVIPGEKPGGHFVGLQKCWERVRKVFNEKAKADKLPLDIDDVRIHDLRHSFASAGLNMGHQLKVVGSLLGHTDLSATQRYAHLAKDPMLEAADAVAGKLSSAMSGEGRLG
jgi:integrase